MTYTIRYSAVRRSANKDSDVPSALSAQCARKVCVYIYIYICIDIMTIIITTITNDNEDNSY